MCASSGAVLLRRRNHRVMILLLHDPSFLTQRTTRTVDASMRSSTVLKDSASAQSGTAVTMLAANTRPFRAEISVCTCRGARRGGRRAHVARSAPTNLITTSTARWLFPLRNLSASVLPRIRVMRAADIEVGILDVNHMMCAADVCACGGVVIK